MSTPHTPCCRSTCSRTRASHRSPDLGFELGLNSGTRAQDAKCLTSLPCCPTVSPPETAQLETHTGANSTHVHPSWSPKGPCRPGLRPPCRPELPLPKSGDASCLLLHCRGSGCLKANPALAVVTWLHSLMCLGRTHTASEPFPALARIPGRAWASGAWEEHVVRRQEPDSSSCSATGAPSLLFSKTRQRRLLYGLR